MAKTNKGRKLFATTATAALVASAIVPVASAAQINDFNTISSYAQEAVQDLVDRGVIQGDEKGNFNPRKSVTRAEAATILVNALELESTGSINFTDVKAGAWYYDAINAAVNNGIFQGQGAGKFNPSGNLTRSEAAIILVDAFGLEGSASLSQFSDSASVKAWAQEALEIAVANGVIKGDNGKLNPNAPITRQDFAVMYSRTEGVEAPVSGAIKAINNTTVEVTFEEPVTDLADIEFTIEGLTVSNKVLKQTDSSTVVLTTSAQEAGKTYVLSVDGEEVGSFTGVASVIPTAVKTVVASHQGVIGKEVTLTAEVSVAEGQSKAGIPVTFNIVNDKSTNSKIEVEALTDDKGVATYSYTRYYNGIDDVVAYATSKSSVKDNAKVYWASAPQLTIKETKEGNTLANGSKKAYEITGDKNSVVFVAFEENLGIKANKVVEVQVTSAVGSIDEKGKYTPYTGSKGLVPYELSTGAEQYVAIELDKNGKGSLILTGSDESVTPIVYEAADLGKLDLDELDKTQEKIKDLDVAYGKTHLQAKAATVKFEQNDKLALEVKALGTEDAAEASVLPADGTEIDEKNDFGYGGRKYEVTVKTKDGELAAAGTTAYVTFEDFEGTNNKVIIGGKVSDIKKDTVYAIKVAGKEGKASFRVIGEGKKSYVTPTVFLNTEGKTSPVELDKKDVQVEAETTYFTEAVVKEAVIKVLNGEFGTEVTSLQAGKTAYAVYQSVDQNGFAYGTGKEYDVTFELSTTFGELKVTGEDVQNVGRTYTYETKSNSKGRAVVEFTSESATTVSIDILGSRNVLPAKEATVKFTQYSTGETTGVVTAYNTTNRTVTIGTNVYSYADAKEYQEKGSKITRAEFEALIAKPNARVSITKDAEDKLTFNVLESVNAPGTGVNAVLDSVNRATSVAEVKTALQGLEGFSTLLAADQTHIATDVFGGLSTAAYTAAQLTSTISSDLTAAKASAVSAKALTDLINAAQAKHNAATEGDTAGSYAVGSKATLQAAINTAKANLDTIANGAGATISSSTAIDALTTTLDTAVTAFEAGKVLDVRPALAALIAEAKALVDANPIAGTKPGQYDAGVITTLNTAVVAAQTAYDTVGSTYAAYKSAFDTLQAALDLAKSQQVKVVSVEVDGTTTAIDLTFSTALNAAVANVTVPAGQTGATAAAVATGATTTTVTINVTGTPAANDIITVTASPVNTSGIITFDLKYNGTEWELVPTDNFVK